MSQTEINFNASFDGADYNDGRDHERLKGQIERVYKFMSDGKWHTLREISDGTGDPEASVSAQLRHLRKPKFGSHVIDKMFIGDGLYKYRMELKQS